MCVRASVCVCEEFHAQPAHRGCGAFTCCGKCGDCQLSPYDPPQQNGKYEWNGGTEGLEELMVTTDGEFYKYCFILNMMYDMYGSYFMSAFV